MSKGTRIPTEKAWHTAVLISDELRMGGVIHEVCGSIKRGQKPDAGDIDIAVRDILKTDQVFKQAFGTGLIFPAKSKYTIPKSADAFVNGIKINVYQSSARSWGAMILFLTGSGLFNIRMRVYAKVHGFKLNQYGLWGFDANGHWDIRAAKTERAIFKVLGLQFIPPEKREFSQYDSLWNYKLGGKK
jgi:DNA polymerase/3'-5' exonuclease PolX